MLGCRACNTFFRRCQAPGSADPWCCLCFLSEVGMAAMGTQHQQLSRKQRTTHGLAGLRFSRSSSPIPGSHDTVCRRFKICFRNAMCFSPNSCESSFSRRVGVKEFACWCESCRFSSANSRIRAESCKRSGVWQRWGQGPDMGSLAKGRKGIEQLL